MFKALNKISNSTTHFRPGIEEEVKKTVCNGRKEWVEKPGDVSYILVKLFDQFSTSQGDVQSH